jgi:hypothetical protein
LGVRPATDSSHCHDAPHHDTPRRDAPRRDAPRHDAPQLSLHPPDTALHRPPLHFWRSRPPMATPWPRALQTRHVPSPPSTDKPLLLSPNTHSPRLSDLRLHSRHMLSSHTSSLTPSSTTCTYPRLLVNTGTPTPLFRQHCYFSSLLVTSVTSRHFARSHHFSSPPSTLCSPTPHSSSRPLTPAHPLLRQKFDGKQCIIDSSILLWS